MFHRNKFASTCKNLASAPLAVRALSLFPDSRPFSSPLGGCSSDLKKKRRILDLLCFILSFLVVLGDAVGDWYCQETKLLWEIPLSERQWSSRSCSSAISRSSWTSPAGSTAKRDARRDTSSRHRTTLRGWPCSTENQKNQFFRFFYEYDSSYGSNKSLQDVTAKWWIDQRKGLKSWLTDKYKLLSTNY